MNSRSVPDFPGYLVTDDGRVLSKRTGKPLKARAHHRTGHLRVRLYGMAARPKTLRSRRTGLPITTYYEDIYVHVLVCLAWHGPPPFEGALVLHLDDDPRNNRPANVRWGTALENAAHREMDDEAQRLAAEAAWSEWTSANDSDGFDWATGEFAKELE